MEKEGGYVVSRPAQRSWYVMIGPKLTLTEPLQKAPNQVQKRSLR